MPRDSEHHIVSAIKESVGSSAAAATLADADDVVLPMLLLTTEADVEEALHAMDEEAGRMAVVKKPAQLRVRVL
jgi:hypothetical protein